MLPSERLHREGYRVMIFKGWKLVEHGASYKAMEVVISIRDRGLELDDLTGSSILGDLHELRACLNCVGLRPTLSAIAEAGVLEFWW